MTVRCKEKRETSDYWTGIETECNLHPHLADRLLCFFKYLKNVSIALFWVKAVLRNFRQDQILEGVAFEDWFLCESFHMLHTVHNSFNQFVIHKSSHLNHSLNLFVQKHWFLLGWNSVSEITYYLSRYFFWIGYYCNSLKKCVLHYTIVWIQYV